MHKTRNSITSGPYVLIVLAQNGEALPLVSLKGNVSLNTSYSGSTLTPGPNPAGEYLRQRGVGASRALPAIAQILAMLKEYICESRIMQGLFVVSPPAAFRVNLPTLSHMCDD
jgi:hypothetical protein